MGEFIRQPDENFPNVGVNDISHLVRSYSSFDLQDLDDTVNGFLADLKSLPETPIVKNISYYSVVDGDKALFVATIFIVLLS